MTDEAQPSLLEADKPAEITSWHSEENNEVVERAGWKGPDDVIQSWRNIEKMSSGMTKMPTPESSAEEISAFYAKMGRPENPDGYEITDVPENIPRDEMMESLMRKVAFDRGIPKASFEAQIKSYYDALSQGMAQAQANGIATLEKDWGAAYKANTLIVQRACDELIPDTELHEAFAKLINDTGLQDNPIFGKVFLGIGTRMLDDTLVKGDGTPEPKSDYVPKFANSPEQYATGEDKESEQARAYFTARGHNYG